MVLVLKLGQKKAIARHYDRMIELPRECTNGITIVISDFSLCITSFYSFCDSFQDSFNFTAKVVMLKSVIISLKFKLEH